MKSRLIVVLVVLLLLSAVPLLAATIEVSGNTALTSNAEYDRNPSIINDGADYWLFYTKGDDTSTSGVRGGSYDPDADSYVAYYKKASSIAGLAGASETQLTNSAPPNRPTGFDQRVVSATYFNSKVYAFVSSGQSGTDRGLYYYAYSGGSWTGPDTLIADTGAPNAGGHVNVTSDASYIYIVWECADGSSDAYTWDEVTLSSRIDISTDNQPKITLMGTTLYVASIEDGTTDIEVHSATAGASPSFSSHSTAIPNAGFYDPCIFNDGTDLYVVTAPYDAINDQQWLVQTRYSSGSWATYKQVSYGGYGGTYWWEYWPIGYHDGADAYVFFTTETASPVYSDGEIAYFKMDWDLGNDHYFYVQNAIDQAVASDTLNVASGSYEEQLEISKALTLDGAGKGVTTVQSPASLSKYFTTGTNNNYPIIYVHDADGVTVKDMTIDGLSRGNANYRFCGLGYYNAGGAIDNCEVKDIKDSPISGAQHGVAIYALADTSTARTLDISACDVYGYQKNGMALKGEYLTANVDGCTVTGYGPASFIAQNGVQMSSGATGTIGVTSANTISGNSYTPHTWAATGILLLSTSGTVQVKNNTLSENSECLYCWDTSATIEDNTLTVTQAGTGVADYWAMICDPGTSGRRPVQAFDDMPEESRGDGDILATFNYTVNGNVIDGDDGANSLGLDIWCNGTDNMTFSGSNNRISDFDCGVLITEESPGLITSVNFTSNMITSNVTYGVYNEVSGLVAYSNKFAGNGTNAEDNASSANQWDSGSCPGNYWDDYRSNSGYPGQYNITGTAWSIDDCPLSIDVTLDPATHLMACGETISYHVNVDGNALDLMGADYKINYDSTKLSFVSAVVGSLLNTGAGDYIFTYQSSTGQLLINSAHLGTGVNGPGEIAEVTFQSTGSTSPGSTPLTFSDTQLRDSGNQTLPSTWTGASVVIDCVAPTIAVSLDTLASPWTCYNTAPTVDITAGDDYDLDCVKYKIDAGSWVNIVCDTTGTSYTNDDWTLPDFGSLSEGSHEYYFKSTDDAGNESPPDTVAFTKDTIAPSAVTGFTATVDHNQIVLDWTNPGSDVDRIYLYRNDWTDYPEYAAADPGYPSVGSYHVETDVGAVVTHTDTLTNTTRGIYAYRAVVYDCAGNYASAGSDDHDRATSYFLGDIGSIAGSYSPNYDGLVSGFDYNPFSGCYWSSPATDSTAECDFAPTIEPARGRFGIPQPDDYVGFEDLMIFSMNYGNVPPPSPPGAPVLGVELVSVGLAEDALSYRVSLREVSEAGDMVELALVVEGNDLFKGLSAEVEYDHMGLEFVSVMPSEALMSGSRVLFMGDEMEGVVRVDLAALGGGVGIGGNGPVAMLSFLRRGESGSSVKIASVDARDVDNNVLLLTVEDEVQVKPGLPEVFALRGNSPNPFTGSTEISYDIPRESSVMLRIYNIQGQVVRTLVDGAVSAGRHSETWDGLDSQGRKVSAGVYFCEMKSGSFASTHKLMISR